ncbi:MAG: RodZ domain-containing protein [Ardenticatenaceae bacterium]
MKQTLPFLATVLLVMAFSMPSSRIVAQDNQATHSIRVDVFEPSSIEVVVDGLELYNGILEGDLWRVWTGEDIYLKIGNGSGVQVTYNGLSLGVLGGSGEEVSRHWAPQDELSVHSLPIPFVQEFGPPSYHIVEEGETLYGIARRFNVPLHVLTAANNMSDSTLIVTGQQLIIPGSDGSLPEDPFAPINSDAETRGSVVERMTMTARLAASNSPYHKKTWVTFYGRPQVPVMGILGEYTIDDLIPLMSKQANAYDEANGAELGVTPAFHLVYGMATREPGEEKNYLSYLEHEVVMKYIERAQQEGFGVILDIQVGALEPLEAMRRAFFYLQYDNVQLALDPEFAMTHPNQKIPGTPIGFVTAEQANQIQSAMREYMKEEQIRGRRMLIIHQYLDTMIVNKEDFARVYKVDLTISAAGWGTPWGKISKYNSFINHNTKFAGFKLFYRWDDPLLTERQVLGIERHLDSDYIQITPNLIIYQ